MKKARSDKNELDLTPNTRMKMMDRAGKDAVKRVRQKLLMRDQAAVVPKHLRNTYDGVLHFCDTNTRDARRKDLGAAFDENSAYVVDGYVIAACERARAVAQRSTSSHLTRCVLSFSPAGCLAAGTKWIPPTITCST